MNDHAANSDNGHDPRAGDDLFGPRPMDDDTERDATGRAQARQAARAALAETIHRHHRIASVAYGSIHAALRDADKTLALWDVGHPLPVEGDVSAYERAQIRRWEQAADDAERRAPGMLKRLARDLRRIADRIEEEVGSS